MLQQIYNRTKYRIVPVVCLVMAVLFSRDVFPEYNYVRYGFILAGILSIFIGGHNSILKGIAILEILISFSVVFEKTNAAENKIEAKNIYKLERRLKPIIGCEKLTNQWAILDCADKNEPNITHNDEIHKKIAELKTSVPTIKVLKQDPSLLAFIIFSCALPWLSFLSAKKIEIEKEIVIEERIVEKEIQKIVEVPVEKIVKEKINLAQFVRDLFSDKSDSEISEQYQYRRGSIADLRVQYCPGRANKRTVNVQMLDNVVNIRGAKNS